jgi:hypothetical protein
MIIYISEERSEMELSENAVTLRPACIICHYLTGQTKSPQK